MVVLFLIKLVRNCGWNILHFLLGYLKNRAIEISISLLSYPPEVQIYMK